jgi:cytochrome c553
MKTHIQFILIAGIGFASCSKDKTNQVNLSNEACTSSTISYSKEIAPIMSANCISCHDSGNQNGNVNLSSFEMVNKNATKALTAIKNGTMPPNGKMEDSLIIKLNCWISQGKKNN